MKPANRPTGLPTADPDAAHAAPEVDLIVRSDAAPSAPAKPKRFRVWKHGGLHCDGVFFAAGEELPLGEAEITSLGITCAEPIEEG